MGLGLWSSEAAVNVGEYGTLAVGLVVYILTLLKLMKEGPPRLKQGVWKGKRL